VAKENEFEDVRLLSLLNQLKEEIGDWQSENTENERKPMFSINNIDLETKFAIRKETAGEGKFDLVFVPITIGGSAKYGSEEVHTLKLSITPMEDHGQLGEDEEPAPHTFK